MMVAPANTTRTGIQTQEKLCLLLRNTSNLHPYLCVLSRHNTDNAFSSGVGILRYAIWFYWIPEGWSNDFPFR